MPQPKKSSSGSSRRRSPSASSRSGASKRSTAAKSTGRSKPAAKKPAAKKPAAKKSAAKSRTTAASRSGSASTARKPARRAPARSRRTAAPSATAAAKRTATAAQQQDAGGVTAGLNALRDALTSRAADSLNLVMLTRDLVQEAFDDAVERGHMTRETAESLATELVKRSRKEAVDILADIEQLAGRSRTGLEQAGKKVRTSSAADRALQQVDRARRTVGVGPNFPVLGYDDLTAAQISERLDGLTPAELRKVRDYERRHGNRKSVLGAIEKKLA